MKAILRSIISLLVAATLFMSCKKECDMTPAIIVNAGPDQTIQLPADTATLTGTVTSGQSPTLIYTWSKISGPGNPVITNSSTTKASVSGLVLGNYVFQFQAENSAGTLIGLDTMSIQITPPIIVNAGPDQVLTTANTATLTGTVTSGQSPTLVYSWTELSGPSSPAITNSHATTASVSGLAAGSYVFQFQAENSEGHIGLDTMSMVVSAVSATLTIQPTNNLYEGDINLYGPTQWITDGQIYAEAWTDGGAPFVARACLKFDYSGLPAGAVVDNAILYLYSDPNPINGDKINAQAGPSNACYVQRITSSWVLPTPFTWNSPPSVTTIDEATIPQSTASNSDATADVTALVNDMLTNTNEGFFIVLQNEVTYNTRQWASSSATNAALHPKLVIQYH